MIQQKLAAFFIVQSTWIMWLLLGLSMGGLAVVIERAVYLISTTEAARRLKRRISNFARGRALVRANNILASRRTLSRVRPSTRTS
jgi:biopolymer transport protein ExbB/TolQ